MSLPLLIGGSIGLALGGIYVFIISHYLKGWKALPEWVVPSDFVPQTQVSIIVPARNEEKGILTCLQSIVAQNFPPGLFEILVVDDHSTDDTAKLVEAFSTENTNVKLLRLADFIGKEQVCSFKKKAIEIAISKATGKLIMTTDADCEVTPDWLMLMVSFFEKRKLKFIAAPVNFYREKSLLERFQSLDFLGMMGVTGAGIQLRWMSMCNGANLAYSKAAFQEVGGFTGIDQLASGDDILLMQKMVKRFPDQIGFLKNPSATVFTKAKPDLKSLGSQRLRWATKSSSYQEWTVPFMLAVVLFLCLGIMGTFLAGLFLHWAWLALALLLFSIKAIVDYFFLREMCRYFGRTDLLSSFFVSQIMHILYIGLIGVGSNLKKRYEWKGRDLR